MKIKLKKTAYDSISVRDILAGEIVDLGAERNEKAVKNGFAEWVEQPTTEKKETEKPTEKKAETVKKTTTPAKPKK